MVIVGCVKHSAPRGGATGGEPQCPSPTIKVRPGGNGERGGVVMGRDGRAFANEDSLFWLEGLDGVPGGGGKQ